MASDAILRQLAARGPLLARDVETIYKNYTQKKAPDAAIIASLLGRAVEWHEEPRGWTLAAAAEMCIVRAVSDTPIALNTLPKSARLWFREHHRRMCHVAVECSPGMIVRPHRKRKRTFGPISISHDGSLEKSLLDSKNAFPLGCNLIIEAKPVEKAPEMYLKKWMEWKSRQDHS
jgi:hypothetical protein